MSEKKIYITKDIFERFKILKFFNKDYWPEVSYDITGDDFLNMVCKQHSELRFFNMSRKPLFNLAPQMGLPVINQGAYRTMYNKFLTKFKKDMFSYTQKNGLLTYDDTDIIAAFINWWIVENHADLVWDYLIDKDKYDSLFDEYTLSGGIHFNEDDIAKFTSWVLKRLDLSNVTFDKKELFVDLLDECEKKYNFPNEYRWVYHNDEEWTWLFFPLRNSRVDALRVCINRLIVKSAPKWNQTKIPDGELF